MNVLSALKNNKKHSKMKKSISMAALMSLTTSAAFAADKPLGFNELYSNPKAITQAMQENNAQLPVSEAVSATAEETNLIKLNDSEKLMLINALSQNGNIKLANTLSANISEEMLTNDKVFIIGKKNSDNFKIIFASRNLNLLSTAKDVSIMAKFIGRDSKWFSGGGEFQTCVQLGTVQQCKLKTMCYVACGTAAGVAAGGVGGAVGGVIGGVAGGVAGGTVSGGIAGGVGAICKEVCEDVEDCQEVTQCVEWR